MSTLITNNNCCATCGKQYSRKSSLDRHVIMCNFLFKSKRERQIEKEENTELPSHTQLVKIVQELAYKCDTMEKEMTVMRKWIDKKKKKINIINWLNTNHVNMCEIDFTTWFKELDLSNNEYIELLFTHNIFQVLHTIFEQVIDINSPIKCFSQKAHVFYIFTTNYSDSAYSEAESSALLQEEYIWRQMTCDDWIPLLRTIQKKLLGCISKWREANVERLRQNDKLSELYNKAIIKVTNIPVINTDSGMSKVRGALYNQIKTDLKAVLEYEFEF